MRGLVPSLIAPGFYVACSTKIRVSDIKAWVDKPENEAKGCVQHNYHLIISNFHQKITGENFSFFVLHR